MKTFVYDSLLEEENICNLKNEKASLLTGIKAQKKMVVYGIRNCGKTSLVKNVVIPQFEKQHKESFVLFCDLMDSKNMRSLEQRIQLSFERAFNKSFPGQNLIKKVKDFISHLKPQIELDPLSGQPSLSLGTHENNKHLKLTDIFDVIKNNIAPHVPTLIVLDEFQDIAFIDEAQGIFRQIIQEMASIPVIFMGSKKHILSDLFAKPRAPLALTGEDIAFKPIAYNEYHTYMLDRFKKRKIHIEAKTSQYLQDSMHRIPEPINIVCSYLYDHFESCDIDTFTIDQTIQKVIEARTSRYQEYLSHFSENEEAVLIKLAHQKWVKQPTSKHFLNNLNLTQRAVSQIMKRFLDKSVIEKQDLGYRLSDPLLNHYLIKYR